MPTWLKNVLIFSLGPVLVALGLGFFLGGRSVKSGIKNGKLEVDSNKDVKKKAA